MNQFEDNFRKALHNVVSSENSYKAKKAVVEEKLFNLQNEVADLIKVNKLTDSELVSSIIIEAKTIRESQISNITSEISRLNKFIDKLKIELEMLRKLCPHEVKSVIDFDPHKREETYECALCGSKW